MPNKILIVDDDPDFLFILDHVLSRVGYEVISAESGRECLEKVDKEKPDMVILDVMMPGMDGWEVCRKIKEVASNLPVSMCSVLREPRDIEKSFKYAGADDHITKPLRLDNVLDTVGALLADPTI